jgi:hypothetical protein
VKYPVYIVYARNDHFEAPVALCFNADSAELLRASFDRKNQDDCKLDAATSRHEHFVKGFISEQTINADSWSLVCDLTDDILSDTRG